MRTRNPAISVMMIALLVLMQLVLPFLHTHASDSHTLSTYEIHSHNTSDHENVTMVGDIVHFEAPALYVSTDSHTITKTITPKNSNSLILSQDNSRLIASSEQKIWPHRIPLIPPEPITVGFMALAPPLA